MKRIFAKLLKLKSCKNEGVLMVFAAIDLGSRKIKLKIAQFTNKEWSILEDITKEIKVGEEVYLNQMISYETTMEIIKIMSFFLETMTGYDTASYKAVATSSFRTALNGQNVLSQIERKTGVHVACIGDAVEKFLTYKAMRDYVPDYAQVRKSLQIIELNAGGTDISFYHKNKLVKNIELSLGLKKLKYTLLKYEGSTISPMALLRQYIKAQTSEIEQWCKTYKIRNFMALGGDFKGLASLLYHESDEIRVEDLRVLCRSLDSEFRKKVEKAGIDWYESASAAIFLENFISLTQANTILLPQVSLRDGLLATMAEEHYNLKRYKVFNDDILHVVKETSAKFHSNMTHLEQVNEHLLHLLKAIEHVYPLMDREVLLLKIAVYLHEVGKFVRAKDYGDATYNILKEVSLFGIEKYEMDLIAEVCKAVATEVHSLEMFSKLPESVQKFSSLILVADAMDKSKKGILTIKNIIDLPFSWTIIALASSDSTIEQLDFEQNAMLFQFAYGIQLNLEVRKDVS